MTMVYRVHTIELGGNGHARLVVNTTKMGPMGPRSRDEAIAFAVAEAREIGWPRVSVERVARTPSGAWSISVERA